MSSTVLRRRLVRRRGGWRWQRCCATRCSALPRRRWGRAPCSWLNPLRDRPRALPNNAEQLSGISCDRALLPITAISGLSRRIFRKFRAHPIAPAPCLLRSYLPLDEDCRVLRCDPRSAADHVLALPPCNGRSWDHRSAAATSAPVERSLWQDSGVIGEGLERSQNRMPRTDRGFRDHTSAGIGPTSLQEAH